MNPEEEYKNRVLRVLNKIKLGLLLTDAGLPFVKYRKGATNKYESDVLNKLVDLEAIRIVQDPLSEFIDFEKSVLDISTAVYGIKKIDVTRFTVNGDEVFLRVGSKFEEIYKEFANVNKRDHKLELGKVKFIYTGKPKIQMNDLECLIPIEENEFYLCKVLFNSRYKIGTPVYWDIIFKEMTGNSEIGKKHQRSVYDTMRRLNARIMKDFKTNDKLFTWENKTITRNF